MTNFHLTLKTLSPVHIGDGIQLREDFDFHVDERNKITYFLNQDAILDEQLEDISRDSKGNYLPPAKLLETSKLKDPKFLYYSLSGIPNTQKRNVFSPVRSFVKNGFRIPYIPGSSLKGSIRNALGRAVWKDEFLSILNSPADLQRVDDEIEKEIFGSELERDLLRAFQVSDLTLSFPSVTALRVAQVSTWTMRGKGVPITVEAMKGGMELTGTLKVDDYLFGEIAEERLHLSEKRDWLDVEKLIAKIKSRSIKQFERLAGWFEDVPDGKVIAAIYRNWLSNIVTLPSNQAYIQFGWGSGWDGMTYGSELQESDSQEFEKTINKYAIQPTRNKSVVRQAGDFFPESRRVEVGVNGKPKNPFGWAMLELMEQKKK